MFAEIVWVAGAAGGRRVVLMRGAISEPLEAWQFEQVTPVPEAGAVISAECAVLRQTSIPPHRLPGRMTWQAALNSSPAFIVTVLPSLASTLNKAGKGSPAAVRSLP